MKKPSHRELVVEMASLLVVFTAAFLTVKGDVKGDVGSKAFCFSVVLGGLQPWEQSQLGRRFVLEINRPLE